MPTETEKVLPTQFPVAVIMGHQGGQRTRWERLRREPIAVVAGAHVASKDAHNTAMLSQDDDNGQILCSGFTLRLHRDEVESYYFNLMGERPSLFVICSDDEAGRLTPFLVTCSYDEATAHTEVEEHVFSLPLPPEVYRWVEQFVLKHYLPSRKKKRKRENWKNQVTKYTHDG